MNSPSVLSSGSTACKEVFLARLGIQTALKRLRNLFDIVALFDKAKMEYGFPLDTESLTMTLNHVIEELGEQTQLFADILSIVMTFVRVAKS
jgi:hypothetical protein